MKHRTNATQGICHFRNPKTLHDNGYAILTPYVDKTVITLDLYDLPSGLHGFHIHQLGDMRSGCQSLGSHYDPIGHSHKGLNQSGHIGDLGNIKVDNLGRCNQQIISNYLPLTGAYGVIGRGMIIHEKADDFGLGSDEESRKTGNSGARISCGVIGFL